MIVSLSTRVFTSSYNPLSVGTFIKHFPTLKPSILKYNNHTSLSAKTTLTSPFAATSSSDFVDNLHFQTLNSHQKHQISRYIDSLLEWNQKMNLTAVKEENEVMERHVEDSLAIIRPIQSSYLSHCGDSLENLRVIDVGSGAGLPGLVLAIACPSWKVTLLESMSKRCVFLEHVVDSIGLQNVQVIRDRAESLGQNLDFRESFDIAVARAVAEMRVLAEYCLPLIRIGGLFVAAKGHDPQEEVLKADRAIKLMGASLLQTCLVESHSQYGQRTAILCLKDCSTTRKYPRSPGSPSKLPL